MTTTDPRPKLAGYIERANANQDKLADLKAATKARLAEAKPAEVEAAFESIVFIDFNAAALEEALPLHKWGFTQHDARFLRSLRDQTLGIGQEKQALTRAQLKVIKPILRRDPYLTQVALQTEQHAAPA